MPWALGPHQGRSGQKARPLWNASITRAGFLDQNALVQGGKRALIPSRAYALAFLRCFPAERIKFNRNWICKSNQGDSVIGTLRLLPHPLEEYPGKKEWHCRLGNRGK